MGVAISIIIVNYNGGNLLEACVRSIAQFITTPHEVIVVDNASTDDSLHFLVAESARFPHVRLIQNRENHGFALANNLGASHAHGAWFHFLNPDTRVDGELDACYRALLEADCTACAYTTALKNEAGAIEKSRFLLPTAANYLRALWGSGGVRYWWLGASVILSRQLFHRLGGWSTDYFMYAEDVDLFYRLAVRGIPVVQLACAVTHIGMGTTTHVWSTRARALRIERSARRFHAKRGRMVDYYFVTPILVMRYFTLSPRQGWTKLRAVIEAALHE